jgi:hypothetical protein
MNNSSPFRRFSTLLNSLAQTHTSVKPTIPGNFGGRKWKPIPIPHRTVPEPRGQELDFINVAHSHLIHSDWTKLSSFSLEFFNWVGIQKPSCHSLEIYSMILHILTNNRKFKSAESILRRILVSCSIDVPSNLFEEMLQSYRLCDSSPRAFDSLVKTFAHVKKFRDATDTCCRMKDYGFFSYY